MTKTLIQNKLEILKIKIDTHQDIKTRLNSILTTIEDELSDLTLEESELELELAKIEEQEELTTYPSTDEKYGDFTGVTNEDR